MNDQPPSASTTPPEHQSNAAPVDAGTETPDDIQASNVRLPESLAAQVMEEAKVRKYTNGDLVIHALETATQNDTLAKHLYPAGTVGGKLFKTRGVGMTVRTAGGPKATVSFSLFLSDFETIDELKVEYGARSRNHLIEAALTAYFDAVTP